MEAFYLCVCVRLSVSVRACLLLPLSFLPIKYICPRPLSLLASDCFPLCLPVCLPLLRLVLEIMYQRTIGLTISSLISQYHLYFFLFRSPFSPIPRCCRRHLTVFLLFLIFPLLLILLLLIFLLLFLLLLFFLLFLLLLFC